MTKEEVINRISYWCGYFDQNTSISNAESEQTRAELAEVIDWIKQNTVESK